MRELACSRFCSLLVHGYARGLPEERGSRARVVVMGAKGSDRCWKAPKWSRTSDKSVARSNKAPCRPTSPSCPLNSPCRVRHCSVTRAKTQALVKSGGAAANGQVARSTLPAPLLCSTHPGLRKLSTGQLSQSAEAVRPQQELQFVACPAGHDALAALHLPARQSRNPRPLHDYRAATKDLRSSCAC